MRDLLIEDYRRWARKEYGLLVIGREQAPDGDGWLFCAACGFRLHNQSTVYAKIGQALGISGQAPCQ